MMTVRMMRGLVLGMVLAFFVPDAQAFPWEQKREGRGGDAERVAERIKAKREGLIRERIGLDEATATAVIGVLDRFDPKRRTLIKRKQQLRQALKALFESDSADETRYESALAEWEAIELAQHALRKEQHAALKKVVSPRYQLRIFVALKRLQKRVHQRMDERRERRRGGGVERGGDEGRRPQGRRGGRGR